MNRGYILLGLALAHAHSRPLDELGRTLWEDLGMTSTVSGPVARDPQVAPQRAPYPGCPPNLGYRARRQRRPPRRRRRPRGSLLHRARPRPLRRVPHRPRQPLHGWLRASALPFTPIEAGVDRGLSWICAPGGVACHHGFTGTSLYLAPASGRYLTILTNAVYHGEARKRIAPLRALALKTITAI
ncbi:serine hydrolase [Streptomyces sp. WAC06614]|uniref:serine hydrolase n=1 Tax=Streptomyces sp. WAC06614 TaxID=2487416 RepID=UPI0034D962E5